MFLNTLKPLQALKGANQKVKPDRKDLDLFMEKLSKLLDKLNELSEFIKNRFGCINNQEAKQGTLPYPINITFQIS